MWNLGFPCEVGGIEKIMQLNSDPIIAFKQFGFVKDKDLPGGHVRGHCPFCPPRKEGQSAEGHFFINAAHPNKTWDCKRCGRHGGFQMFLKSVVEASTNRTEGKVRELADQRGLAVNNLMQLNVGWFNGNWTVPVFGIDGEIILNIRLYDGDSFRNTATCNAAMYGLWLIPKAEEYDEIYVCEGEWDYMAFREFLPKRAAMIAVPGAGIFKQDCAMAFSGKRAVLLYDNDEAGMNGTKRAIGILQSVTPTIYKINWPSDVGEGYDIRDVYTKMFRRNKEQSLRWIQRHLVQVTKEDATANAALETVTVKAPRVEHKKVYETFQKWLHLEDNPKYQQRATDLFDVIFGTALGNRIPGPPVWLFIVAPPGGLKTEPLLACRGGRDIELVGSVTPPALISGHGTAGSTFDPSLIPKFNGKLVIMKDYTDIIGLPEFERKEIHNILRGGYDGLCERRFGNGLRREYESTFGILAAVTPAIEMFIEDDAALGERFLLWRNWLPEDHTARKRYIRKALENTVYEKQMKSELNFMGKQTLLADYEGIPTYDESTMEQIISLAQWISMLRGLVPRDKFSKKVLRKPFMELGTRISKSLLKLAMGISLFKWHPTIRPDTMRIIRSVAKSSIGQRYLDVFNFTYSSGPEKVYSLQTLADGIGLPLETIEITAGNLGLLGMLSRQIIDGKIRWKITESFHKLTMDAGLYAKKS